MANQVGARLRGDDYQHLFAWQYVLELLMPRNKVRSVTIEDALAGSVDDVTVRYDPVVSKPEKFYQIKYHVDQRDVYSAESLIESKRGSASLLEKFWRSWKSLKADSPSRQIVLYLVSNWTWAEDDVIRPLIDGHDNSIKASFFTEPVGSKIGKVRDKWRTTVKANENEFQEFIECLRFRLGYDSTQELEQRVAERMENLRLRADPDSLLVAAGIVRKWIESGKQELSLQDVEQRLKECNLVSSEWGVTVYLVTVKAQKFDFPPDYLLDWRSYFTEAGGNIKGHQLKDPSAWNTSLLPQLYAFEERINEETDCRLIRARGLARLSAWFAFGHAFSAVNRYTIEIDQNSRLWRTDTSPNQDFRLVIESKEGLPEGEAIQGKGDTVCVGISVTASLEADVRKYIAEQDENIAALLLLRPERELGRECLRDGGDAVALADRAKEFTRNFIKRWSAKRLLLFYYGPLSGACFIGHRLSAMGCQEIQIMEDQQPGYTPSFLLRG